jgi:hypothetical protein
LQGQLRATFLYSNPQNIKGVNVPTVMKIMNAENKLAGESKYTNLKVNEGLADSLFNTQ